MQISFVLPGSLVALFLSSFAFAAPTQVAGAKCSTVRLDAYGTLSVQAGSKTVNLNTPINFKCGTLTVSDDGKVLRVAGKTLTEALSVVSSDDSFAQVWGLYVVNFSKPGVLSIIDSSDRTVPTNAMLAEMKGAIGDASAAFSQPGLNGWIFKNGQSQTVKYNASKPVTVVFKSTDATPPFSSVVIDAKKGTVQAKRNSL